MKDRKTNSGTWLVIGIVALGVAMAVVGLKYRQFPGGGRPATAPATTQAAVEG